MLIKEKRNQSYEIRLSKKKIIYIEKRLQEGPQSKKDLKIT